MTLAARQFQARFREAIAHHKAGRLDRAQALYEQLLIAQPRDAQILELCGHIAMRQGRANDAVRFFESACRGNDGSIARVLQLARALITAQRSGDAEKLLRDVVEKFPSSSEAWNTLAYVLRVRGRLVDAARCHDRAVAQSPNSAEAWYHYGLTMGAMAKNTLALGCHERALKLNPDFNEARFGRAQALHKLFRMQEAIADYDVFLQAEPGHHEARSYRLFALQNLDTITREQLFAEHRAYGDAVGDAVPFAGERDFSPTRRLRVAILSPDLRSHSCAYFLEPLLRHLEPEEFEIFLYHDHFVEDAVSARLRGLARGWRNFVGQLNSAVERLVRADRPDILIDLTGHIGATIRLPMLARRVAPVQITYLGYPDTTGVPAMDFRFTDPIADPEGEADAFATEKLVRFAPTAWAYEPPSSAPDVPPLPCAAEGAITFGCFNSPTKFTASLFSAWERLLLAVPNSRLLLKGRDLAEPAVRDHLIRRMRDEGVPVDRVEFLPRTADTASHLAVYRRVDVALDTFPYNGTTTTCEALWMGRPVITLRGDRHASRVGASLLSAIGRREWIADSIDDYVGIAAELAADRSRLCEISSRLRAQMKQSRLLDHAAQATAFGAALRACWKQTCERMSDTPVENAEHERAAEIALGVG